jgi:hypothetical protein
MSVVIADVSAATATGLRSSQQGSKKSGMGRIDSGIIKGNAI